MTDPSVRTQIVEVTPAQATTWLNANVHNRPLRSGVVERYSEVMKQGKWVLTHQGVAFDEQGRLIDGQHRLFAIVESDCTVRMMVTRCLSMKVQAMIDDHAKRSALDVGVVMHGLTGLTAKHVGAARVMWTLCLGKNIRLITNESMTEFLKKYISGLNFAVTDVFRNSNVRGVTNAAVIAVISQAYYQPQVEKEQLITFGDILLRGIGTKEHDGPALLLRSWLVVSANMGLGSHGRPTVMVYRKAMRALYAYLHHEKLEKLYESKEQLFPLIKEAKKNVARVEKPKAKKTA